MINLDKYRRLADLNHEEGCFGRDNAEGRCGHCLMYDLIDEAERLRRLEAERAGQVIAERMLREENKDRLLQEVETERAARRSAEREYLVLREQADELEQSNEKLRATARQLIKELEEAKSLPLPETHVLLAEANNRLTVEVKRLQEALERIRDHVGAGAVDIVVANTVLGRIDQEARKALRESGAAHVHKCMWDPMDGHSDHECECGHEWGG